MNMKPLIRMTAFLLLMFLSFQQQGLAQQKRILVFSKTTSFRHSSAISEGKKVIGKLAKQHDFLVDTSENVALFTPEGLSKYDALVFLCTTGDLFDAQQKQAFQSFVESGGGFMGIHSATDTEHSWPWYGKLVGAYFKNHPPGLQEVALRVVNQDHPATAHLPVIWNKKDEIYNFKQISPDIQVLITVDEKSYKGGENGDDHPMSWYHTQYGGRAFYTALGHDAESFQEEAFQQHLLGGITYVLGKGEIKQEISSE